MISLRVLACYFNIYHPSVHLDMVLYVADAPPFRFDVQLPEPVLTFLQNTPLFNRSKQPQNANAADWTGQEWQITLSTTT
jgi:hypothetical protein